MKFGLFVYYVVTLWILFKTSVLAEFFFGGGGHCLSWGSCVLPCHTTVEIEVQISYLTTLKPERELLVTVGRSWDF